MDDKTEMKTDTPETGLKWPKPGKSGSAGPKKCIPNFKYLLDSVGIKVRRNLVTKKNEITGSEELAGKDYNIQTVAIRDMTTRMGLNLSKQDTNDFLDYIADKNKYSPVCDYLEDCYHDYDGKDYITPLFNMFVLDPDVHQNTEFCKKLFSKFLLECAAIPFNCKSVTAPATQEGVLTLVSTKQGIGKTRFPRNTILKDMPEYLITGETIDPKDKDSVSRASGCWLFELSEFEESLTTKKQDALKSFIDRGVDRIRPVYAREQVDNPRICVLYATTNRTNFLYDSTGGRRWWPIAIKAINIDKDFNARQLWGQVMHLLRDEHEEPYLNAEELKELEKHNNNFSAQTDEEIAIYEVFDFSEVDTGKWQTLTAGEIADNLNTRFDCRRYTPKKVGTALTAMSRKDGRITKRMVHGRANYFIPPALGGTNPKFTNEEKGIK